MISKKLITVIVVIIVLVSVVGLVILDNKSEANGSQTMTYIDQEGSTTLYPVCAQWAADFEENNSLVQINVTQGGSGVGITALLDGNAQIADSSAAMNSTDTGIAKEKGMKIVQLEVALDGITIIINPDLSSSITNMTIPELRGLYNGSINNWEELGGPNVPVELFGRNSTSGTYSFFQQTVLDNGPYVNVTEEPDYDSIIDEVTTTPGAIGYIGVGYAKGDLDIVPLKENATSPAYLPNETNVESFKYPLARFLYLYMNGQPSGALLDYLEFIVNQTQGQSLVLGQGFYPISSDITNTDMGILTGQS